MTKTQITADITEAADNPYFEGTRTPWATEGVQDKTTQATNRVLDALGEAVEKSETEPSESKRALFLLSTLQTVDFKNGTFTTQGYFMRYPVDYHFLDLGVSMRVRLNTPSGIAVGLYDILPNWKVVHLEGSHDTPDSLIELLNWALSSLSVSYQSNSPGRTLRIVRDGQMMTDRTKGTISYDLLLSCDPESRSTATGTNIDMVGRILSACALSIGGVNFDQLMQALLVSTTQDKEVYKNRILSTVGRLIDAGALSREWSILTNNVDLNS
jgi:hypothetical protein